MSAASPLLAVERLSYLVGDASPLTILQDISLSVREALVSVESLHRVFGQPGDALARLLVEG